MKEDMQLQKGDSIQWNRETRMDRFGTGLGIHKGDTGKIVEAGPKPGQYLVEIQDQRFLAMHGDHFESYGTTTSEDSVKEIAIVQLESYNGKWSDAKETIYFTSRDRAEQYLEGKGYKRLESMLPSHRDRWYHDLDYEAKVETKQIES
jgi:hypothetical protein